MVVRWALLFLLLASLTSAQVNFQHTSYSFSGYDLLVGDFNGDGAPDLLGHSGDSQDSFLLLVNDGQGNFPASPITIPTGGDVRGIAAFDANKDGHSDIAGCHLIGSSWEQGHIGVWLATAGPNFSAPTNYSVSGLCLNVLAADFNEDGKIDLGATSYSSNGDGTITSTLQVFFGDGVGGFVAGPTSVITDSCSFVGGAISGDFNHDGHADAIISFGCGISTGVAFAYGHGDGTFSFSVSSASEYILNLKKDDVDQDGWLDWTTRGGDAIGGTNLSYFVNTRNGGTPAWKTQAPYTDCCSPGTAAPNFINDGLAADVNGDGLKDAVVMERYSAPDDYNDRYFLTVLVNNGDGTYGAPSRFPVGYAPMWITAAEFDRDGRIDFAVTVSNDTGGTTDIFLNRTSSAPTCPADPIVRSVKVCSPNTLTGNALHLLANTTDSDNVTGMKVYLDNTENFYSPNQVINRVLTVPSGGHRITVTAWDARGSFSSARWINVNTSFGCGAYSTNRSVHLCFPISNTTVGNPTQVVAAVRTSYAYHGAKIYIDGVSKYSTSSKQVNANLNLAAGKHRITVQSSDSQGTFSKTIYATVR